MTTREEFPNYVWLSSNKNTAVKCRCKPSERFKVSLCHGHRGTPFAALWTHQGAETRQMQENPSASSTVHRAPRIKHRASSTKHQAPSTAHQAPSIKHQAPHTGTQGAAAWREHLGSTSRGHLGDPNTGKVMEPGGQSTQSLPHLANWGLLRVKLFFPDQPQDQVSPHSAGW